MAKVAAKKVVKKRRERKNIEKGAVHIQATFNNTIVTVSDAQGNTISWALKSHLVLLSFLLYDMDWGWGEVGCRAVF